MTLKLKLRLLLISVGVILTGYILFIYFYHQAAPMRVGQSSTAQEISKLFTGDVAILQNATFSSESYVTVLRRSLLPQKYQIFDDNQQAVTFQLKSSAINDVYSVDRLDISGLSSGRDYFIKIIGANEAILDARQFRSLDVNNATSTVAVASCARVGWLGHDFGPVSIWDQLFSQQPDALLFLGDMIYPDTTLQALFKVVPSLEQIQDKYIEAWQELHQYHQYNLIPVFSVMDDHDYGFQGANLKNNKDRRDVMLDLFRTFYPIPDKTLDGDYEKGPGAAFKFSAFGYKYIFLDNKYFRTASGPVGSEGEIWGESQLAWLTKLLGQDSRPSFIASGTLFTFPIEQEDSAQHESPNEFARFVQAVKAGKSPVVLMSGDVHFSDVRTIPEAVFGYPTYEITASRIHSVSSLIIPPFFSGYVGPEFGQPIHTYEKNFVLLRSQALGDWKNLQVDIFEKDAAAPLTTKIFAN